MLQSKTKDDTSVFSFLEIKKVKSFNHLISGSPASPILSYLVNYKMFDELNSLAVRNNAIMTVYVDDIAFSGPDALSKKFRDNVIQIIRKFGYQVSQRKIKGYSRTYPKLVTGVIVDSSGKLTIKNSLRLKIITEHKRLRENPSDTDCRKRLRGLVSAVRQVDKTSYPVIYEFAFRKFSVSEENSPQRI